MAYQHAVTVGCMRIYPYQHGQFLRFSQELPAPVDFHTIEAQWAVYLTQRRGESTTHENKVSLPLSPILDSTGSEPCVKEKQTHFSSSDRK